MGRSKPRKAERNAGAFLGPDLLVPIPMSTPGDEYRDKPADPEDSERDPEPEPEPRGLIRRVLERLTRR